MAVGPEQVAQVESQEVHFWLVVSAKVPLGQVLMQIELNK